MKLKKEKRKAISTNPQLLLLYGAPKVGKTTMLSSLDDCLIVDTERSANMLEGYMKKYPECCNMNHWELEHIRFQWWQPGRYFSKWHSEHMKGEPYRVLTYLIYLSDNDCSTDFKRYPSVESKAGCGIIFPAYFTHEHKGNPCKKGLDRYVLTGYFSFV